MPYPRNDPVANTANDRYGAAHKYDFDNPQKWHTVASVPLLDEHEMAGDDGRAVAQVDRSVLEEIAANNNRKVRETGDPATLILGHTSDDPRAPEKPAQGFVVNYHVKPFKRDESGRVIYAIHGDYKLRPEKAHLVEEYPRRSVELWWHKKDIDPIAMLGGSSPERDLGVVLRNARLNHVSLDLTPPRTPSRNGKRSQSDADGDVIRFHRRGNFTIESYAIEPTRYAADKVEKVMSEFKGGTLHSGSKSGPPVTSRKQAVAIALSEAGKSKKDRTMNDTRRPSRYEEGDADTDDFDGGDGAIDDGPDAGQEDPIVAKVMQSKQMKDLFAKIDMIAQAVGVGGGEEPEGGDDAMGGGMGEMPPPGTGADDGTGLPPGGGGEGGGGGTGGEPPPPPLEEESRRGTGQRPVQMGAGAPPSTGFPGQSSGFIPGMGKGRMSRNGSPSMNGQRNRSRGAVDPRDTQILRLRRTLAQRDAEKIIDDLEREGVLFGRDAESAAKIKYARVEELALAILHDEDTKDQGSPDSYVADKIDEMRLCYARRERDEQGRRRPPQSAGVARYARNPVNDAAAAAPDEEYEPQNDQQVMELVDLQTRQKMPQAEALKYMRKKYVGR